MSKMKTFVIHNINSFSHKRNNGKKVYLSRKISNDIDPKKPVREVLGIGIVVIDGNNVSIKLDDIKTPMVKQMINENNTISENSRVVYCEKRGKSLRKPSNEDIDIYVKKLV